MWLATQWAILKTAVKTAWLALLMIGLTILSLVVAGFVLSRGGCSSTTGPDYLDEARQQILDDVNRVQEANRAKLEILEAELYVLATQIDSLEYEIQISIEVREEIHNAIDNAATIDDIDRILRGTIPGVGGRRDD